MFQPGLSISLRLPSSIPQAGYIMHADALGGSTDQEGYIYTRRGTPPSAMSLYTMHGLRAGFIVPPHPVATPDT
jgi:hypothetical protein